MSNNDNRANQCNPNNEEYWHSRGEEYDNPDTRINEQSYGDDDHGAGTKTQADWDNYSNQLNPNNDRYKSSRK
tara:strand:+ start:160 stop:378 length:219 start_codon:yes stop_codon:yes gene_type:complete